MEPVFYDALNGQRIQTPSEKLWQVDDGSASGYLVGPAFFDPQVNGYAGVDFQSPEITREQLEHAAAEMHKAGCSHFLATLMTNSADFLERQFALLARLIDESPTLGKTIVGFHLEGPFISPKPGFVGAHATEHVIAPDWDLFERWQRAAGGRIRLITLAPEWPGSVEFIRHVTSNGVMVSFAHTDASLDQLWAGVNAGARMATHLGNSCLNELPRHDNIIQRILSIPDLLTSIIPDGIHVPPPTLGNLIRTLGPTRTVFTTDAVSPAGAPSGTYPLGDLSITVGEDRVVRHPDRETFAGSSLRPIEGFYNAIRIGGIGVEEAWRGWTRMRNILLPEIVAPQLMIPFPVASPVGDDG